MKKILIILLFVSLLIPIISYAIFGGTMNYDVINDRYGIASTTPFAQLSINTTAGTSSIAIGSSTGTYFLIDKNGNIGIGTTSFVGNLGIGARQAGGSTTISFGKLQFEGMNSTGVKSCTYIVGTSWVVKAGACIP